MQHHAAVRVGGLSCSYLERYRQHLWHQPNDNGPVVVTVNLVNEGSCTTGHIQN